MCYKVCLQEKVTTACDCSYAGYHVNKPSWYTGHFCLYDYCDLNKTLKQAQCILDFQKSVDLTEICPECSKPSCENMEFSHLTSTFDYFNELTAEELVEQLPLDHTSIADMLDIYGNLSNVPRGFASKNFARVEIEFAHTHLMKEVATKSMTPFSLFSDLGGAFGFWIGFSVMTFLEFIEWFIRLILACRSKKCGVKQKPVEGTAMKNRT